jgi:hypothetical protein
VFLLWLFSLLLSLSLVLADQSYYWIDPAPCAHLLQDRQADEVRVVRPPPAPKTQPPRGKRLRTSSPLVTRQATPRAPDSSPETRASSPPPAKRRKFPAKPRTQKSIGQTMHARVLELNNQLPEDVRSLHTPPLLTRAQLSELRRTHPGYVSSVLSLPF